MRFLFRVQTTAFLSCWFIIDQIS